MISPSTGVRELKTSVLNKAIRAIIITDDNATCEDQSQQLPKTPFLATW